MTTTKFNKENSVKHFKNNIKFLAPLSLVLSLSLSPLSAEEDGGFMTFGYELGQVVQSVKNPNKYQAMQVAKELNSTLTINSSVDVQQYENKFGVGNGNDIYPQQGLNVVGNLGNALMVALDRDNLLSPTIILNSPTSSHLFKAYKNISQALEGIGQQTSQEYNQAFRNQYCFGWTTMGPNSCGGNGLVQELNVSGIVKSYFAYMAEWLKEYPNKYAALQEPNLQALKELGYYGTGDLTLGGVLDKAYSNAVLAIDNITNATLQLNNFNAANASGTLSTAEFTGLVDGIISTSSEALQNLKVAGMANGQVGLSTEDVINSNNKNSSNTRTLENMNNFINNTQNTLTKLIQANDNLKAHPWLGQFAAGNSKQTNAMSGFYTKIGYKQFFGKKKAFGLRYYGFFSYNGAGVGNGANYNTVNLLTYGVGTDALYNVFSRSFGSRSIDAGFFTGIQLAGDSYITSLAKSVQVDTKKVTATKFQFLFDVGMRMNFGILKKDMKKHNQHSIEIGVQIPTIYNTYYSNGGTEVKYYRPYSVYWVYGYAF
ncbi:outer membrane protein [Helicobacter cetorum]|uniref:outer membrane protein n=1 Tax=Helicobacter cetorum TaxID=138563 RepID=UPI003AF0B50A